MHSPAGTLDRGRRLHCVGQLTVDTIAQLHAPLALADQTTCTTQTSTGGTAAIVAHNASLLRLGPVSFSGHVGVDAGGVQGLAVLAAAGVSIGRMIRTAASPAVIVLVDPSGERTMVSSPGAPDWSRLDPVFKRGEIVLFEGWPLFGPSHAFAGLMQVARSRGALVALDVCSASRSGRPADHARLLVSLRPDILLANDAEAAVFGLEPASPEQLLVIHAGAAPTRVWQAGQPWQAPVAPCEVVDTTGAGDTFAAGFLAALAAGLCVEQAVEIAHRAAALVVGQLGPLAPTGLSTVVDLKEVPHGLAVQTPV